MNPKRKKKPTIAELAQRKTLTYRQLEEVYGVEYETIRKVGALGTEFTTYRVGLRNGRVLVDRASFERYLERNAVRVAC